ncbi:MAG: TolC family protein [Ginsengibacter sp.]
MKKLLTIVIAVILYSGISTANAQAGKTLTIEQCYQLAKENYPLINQRSLIDKSNEYTIQNIAHGFLPQINFMGQATYQSAVTKIPIKVPGMDIQELSKDQYKAYGEVSQAVYDGGVTREQKKFQEANRLAEQQQLEVDLYALKERINQVYFGILLVDEQLLQNDLLKKDIRAGLNKTKAAIEYGTALKSSGDVLKAELLKADQRTIELQASRKAYFKILGLFINQTLDGNTELIKPKSKTIAKEIQRPELLLFNYRQKSIDVQSKILDAKNRPKINLFLQSGIGRPALNFLSNNAEAYYITGIRFSWPLNGLYNAKKEKAILKNSQKNIDIQKETFLFNTNISLSQQTEEIEKIKNLLQADNEIIALRASIKNTTLAQLENGVITSNDYIREVDAEDVAKQNKMLHEIQLLLGVYTQEVTSGN